MSTNSVDLMLNILHCYFSGLLQEYVEGATQNKCDVIKAKSNFKLTNVVKNIITMKAIVLCLTLRPGPFLNEQADYFEI